MITAIEPEYYDSGASFYANQPIFTVHGKNLNKLPNEILLCAEYTKELADENINRSQLGVFSTLVVLSRSDTEIKFGRVTNYLDYPHTLTPFYITTPFRTPRSIIHEFDDTTK